MFRYIHVMMSFPWKLVQQESIFIFYFLCFLLTFYAWRNYANIKMKFSLHENFTDNFGAYKFRCIFNFSFFWYHLMWINYNFTGKNLCERFNSANCLHFCEICKNFMFYCTFVTKQRKQLNRVQFKTAFFIICSTLDLCLIISSHSLFQNGLYVLHFLPILSYFFHLAQNSI